MRSEVSCRFRFMTVLLPAATLVLGETSVASGQDAGQWINLGPPGAYVKVLALDPQAPSTIYGGLVEDYSGHSSWGVIKSTDGGNSWTGIDNSPLPGSAVVALAIDPSTTPSTVYAGFNSYYLGTVGGGGVYRSTDGGSTWTEADSGLAANLNFGVLTLAIDASTPSTLYAGSDLGGLYRTTDGGSTWSLMAFPNQYVFALATSINTATPSETLYAGTDAGGTGTAGIYASTDGGQTWTALGAGLPNPNQLSVLVMAIDPVTPSTIYAGFGTYYGGTFGALFKSTDGGATWTEIDGGLPISHDLHAIAINPANTNILYVGFFGGFDSGGGAFTSTDGGQTWSDAGLVADQYIHSIVINPVTPTIVYAGTCNTGVWLLQPSPDPGPSSGNRSFEFGSGRRGRRR